MRSTGFTAPPPCLQEACFGSSAAKAMAGSPVSSAGGLDGPGHLLPLPSSKHYRRSPCCCCRSLLPLAAGHHLCNPNIAGLVIGGVGAAHKYVSQLLRVAQAGASPECRCGHKLCCWDSRGLMQSHFHARRAWHHFQLGALCGCWSSPPAARCPLFCRRQGGDQAVHNYLLHQLAPAGNLSFAWHVRRNWESPVHAMGKPL